MRKNILPTGSHPSVCVASGAALGFLKRWSIPSARVLDVGCGTGRFVRQATDVGWHHISGIDGYQYQNDFPYTDFSYDCLPYDDASFDCVTVWEVLEHLENPYHAMREAKRILKGGAILLCSVPNPAHIASRVQFLARGSLARWSETNDHISIFTEQIMKKTIGREMTLKAIAYGSPVLFAWRGRLIGKINRSLPANRLFGLFTLYAFQK